MLLEQVEIQVLAQVTQMEHTLVAEAAEVVLVVMFGKKLF